MPETVPLRAALRVEVVHVVVGDPGDEGLDLVAEGLAAEDWGGGGVEGEAGSEICKCVR